MVQRFFVDTSVFGGVFEPEFERDSTLLFDKVRDGLVVCVYSNVVEEELVKAPPNVRSYLKELSDKYKEKVIVTPEIQKLAQAYIDEKVVGKTSFDDCTHIAAATIYRADALVSWNFKHIVNVDRVRGYNAVNVKLGYQALEIHSPAEVLLWNKK
jgi:hypothetical protein